MWKIVSYYTKNTMYERYANNFIDSLRHLNLPYKILPINTKTIVDNRLFKARFLENVLETTKEGNSIVYLDIDTTFFGYPKFFDILDANPKIDLLVKIDKNLSSNLLSRLIFVRKTEKSHIIINGWKTIDKDKILLDVKDVRFPNGYTAAFDNLQNVENPVVVHFGGSQAVQSIETTIPQPKQRMSKPVPRVITKGNITRIRRTNCY